MLCVGIVEVGGGTGGAPTFFKFFLRSSPSPCLFFSSLIKFVEGLVDRKYARSVSLVLERGIGVGNVAMLIGRRLPGPRGGVSGACVAWK